ncbi:hypothetical protein FFLO_03300 [Filobasidium floriforme]|uniref:Uncharacterized protein n=1 Tax=Filobasidium floriforme TaxID=5210 RepID=A0A8K0NTA3_9TREE|nr:uncharacterized protein HD553DRAFT_363926 [Filobasidium floriforme]KAG7544339.1 hypothetical protein FFLO_03300 [Filobasidium floriforme]KAH8078631.1 hypothetical protein HD553DRAFT_363926 [Filobasidium floriforme]
MPGIKAINKRLQYGPHVLLLFLTVFTIFILLILITFSSPFITTIYFLRAGVVNFGAFGYNSPGFRSEDVLGYEYGLQVLNPLTNAMILWGIATAFALFALISIIPLLWVHDSAALHAVANNTFFTYSSQILTLIVFLIWPMSILGWSIAQRSFNLSDPDVNATLGPAIWMGLAAWILVGVMQAIGWPADVGEGQGDGYYHYRQTTREVTRPRV